ncbi:hypothetical protein BS50DRAFT_576053 [Corynespora cassiicola Philippines]|uniref:Sulfhydryl oxidase n=1 Tax=Corynespora cassiicola Philippines TaxID=1448308 RepID=A0A2T2NGR4_CORCC|nr:hypothetical protein BS50DRAFT_576053 [Corynespora cassiicola Philippines]
MAPGPVEQNEEQQVAAGPQKMANGVILGPDGKPCRTCNSVSSLLSMTKSMSTSKPATATATTSSKPAAAAAATAPTPTYPSDCPPDVEALGRSSWTLLHSITGAYPERPSPTLQSETKTFLHTFAKLYPCWHCGGDFQAWMREAGNAPRVSSRDEFGRWMCEAHNAVNVKLGKSVFDCNRWEERWRTGWRDGRCDF